MHKLAQRTLDDIGLGLDIDQSSARHGYLATYEALLKDYGDSPRILIVGASKPIAFANAFAEFRPSAQVLVIDIDSNTETTVPMGNVVVVRANSVKEMHTAIGGFGPVDVFIEDGSNTRSQMRECLSNLIYHVQDGGVYVIEDLHAINIPHLAQGQGPTVLDDLLAAWVRKLLPEGSPVDAEDRVFSNALGKVELVGKLALITKTGNHAWKQHEVGFKTQVPFSTTLMTIPGVRFGSRAAVRTNNGALRRKRLPDEFDYPAVALRAYADVVASPGQVYHQGSNVLPDTFRHFSRRHLGNRNLESFSHHVGAAAPDHAPYLLGSYYALDSELPGHFGHVTTEVVSRLWGWQAAKNEYHELKALVSASTPTGLAEWEYELFASAGISREDIYVADRPVRVERLIAATPMFNQPGGLHQAITDTWNRMGSHLCPTNVAGPEKIFIGRKPGSSSRACRNGDAVEDRFVAHGFTVIYPEDLPFKEQVGLFRNARTVAGYGGSGMFNLMFAGGPRDVIVIASESYDAVNEYLIAAVLGGTLTYFWCAPDVPHPAEGWRLKSFLSDYEFDFERDGALLDQVLQD